MESTSTSTPCYVFRLISFDEQGNRVQKRKYGFTARSTDPAQLDENVFNGIITRAEQTFNLRPSTYSLYLVLGPGPYTTELGETDLHLDDYPALSSHSWSAFHTFTQFNHKRDLIAALKADKKGRKVVNLCLVKTTLHDVAKARKMKLQLEKGKGKEKMKKSAHSDNDSISTGGGEASPPTSTPDTVVKPVSVSPSESSISAEAPPTPPKQEEKNVKPEEEVPPTKRSSSPTAADVADIVARITNFIAPVPATSGNSGNTTSPSLGVHPGMEFIKRAADFIAPPPPASTGVQASPTRPKSWLEQKMEEASRLSAVGEYDPCAYTHPSSWDSDYISGWRKHAAASSTYANYKTYTPPGRRDTFTNAASATASNIIDIATSNAQSAADKAMKEALAASQRAKVLSDRIKRDALLAAQKAKFEADTVRRLDSLASYPFAGKKDFTQSSAVYRSSPEAPEDEEEDGDNGDVPSYDAGHAFNSVSCGPVKKNTATPSATPAKQASPSTASSTSGNSTAATNDSGKVDKYATLKSSFDKFVNDFNANLADAFGGPVPEPAPLLPSKTTAEKEIKQENVDKGTVFEAKGEKETPANIGVQAAKKAPSHKLVSHNATCDVCDGWITGIRYKCFVCPDWDCCEKCYSMVDQYHPGHALAALHEPNDLVRRKDGSSFSIFDPSTRHFAIHCDSCNKPVTGIRYKCSHTSCPDFDLCATCEADPVSYASNRKIGNHSYKDHLMVKIRKPIASIGGAGHAGRMGMFGGGSVNANRVQLDRAIDGIRKAFPSITTSSSTIPTIVPVPTPTSTTPSAATSSNARTSATANVKSGKEDKTIIIDLPLPFAIQGGQKDIHITFDLGKNDKGETVILNKNGKSFDATLMEAISAELGGNSSENKGKATTVTVDEAEIVEKKEENVQKKNVTVNTQVMKQQSQMTDARLEYDARWVTDVTYPDGESVFPGTVFNRVWNVENTGSKHWPEGTKLVCVSGFGKDTATQHGGRKEASYTLNSTAPGTKVNIIAENIIAPEVAGKFMSYYRFVAPDGSRFGDRLWIDIIVDDDNSAVARSSAGTAADTSSSSSSLKKSDSSLDSSRIVTPTLKVKGSTATLTGSITSNAASGVPESVASASEAVTSPRTTESDLPDIDVMSSLSDEEEDCDFVLLSDDDEYDQV